MLFYNYRRIAYPVEFKYSLFVYGRMFAKGGYIEYNRKGGLAWKLTLINY